MKKLITLIALTITLANAQQAETTPAPEMQSTEMNSPEKVIQKTQGKGANVYNFNFYNQGSTEKPVQTQQVAPQTLPVISKPQEQVELVTMEEEVVPLPKIKPIEHRSGIEFTLGGVVSDMDLGRSVPKITSMTDIKLGRMIMSKSGSYFTPGIIYQSVSANWNENDFQYDDDFDGNGWGGYLKIGKHYARKTKYKFDTGLELSYTAGEFEEKTPEYVSFYNDPVEPYKMKYSQLAASFYAGPIWEISDSFLFAAVVNAGARGARIEGESKTLPFWAINLNTTFKF